MSNHKNEIQKISPDVPQLQVYESIHTALANARTKVYNTINSTMVMVYWEIGREISEVVGDRAEYGKQLLQFGTRCVPN